MIKQFDKQTCKLLATEVEKALAAVAAKHGLTASYAGGTFSGAEFTAKVKFTLAQNNPAAADAERAEFAKYCGFYGLKPEHYGAKLPSGQFGEMTLVGIKPSRSKFPIVVRCTDGTTRLFTSGIVKHLASYNLTNVLSESLIES